MEKMDKLRFTSLFCLSMFFFLLTLRNEHLFENGFRQKKTFSLSERFSLLEGMFLSDLHQTFCYFSGEMILCSTRGKDKW